jgi:hypothetical protein
VFQNKLISSTKKSGQIIIVFKKIFFENYGYNNKHEPIKILSIDIIIIQNIQQYVT